MKEDCKNCYRKKKYRLKVQFFANSRAGVVTDRISQILPNYLLKNENWKTTPETTKNIETFPYLNNSSTASEEN